MSSNHRGEKYKYTGDRAAVNQKGALGATFLIENEPLLDQNGYTA